jgi:hypothetical protein
MAGFFACIRGFEASFFYPLGSLIAGFFGGLAGFDASLFGFGGTFARFFLFGGCAGPLAVAVVNGAALCA